MGGAGHWVEAMTPLRKLRVLAPEALMADLSTRGRSAGFKSMRLRVFGEAVVMNVDKALIRREVELQLSMQWCLIVP